MYKLVMLVRRGSDLSVADFQAYWLNQHGPLVAKIPCIRRYIQTHPLQQGYSKGELVFDGVGEVWFDDEEAFRTAAKTAEFREASKDAARFVDISTMKTLPVEVVLIKDGEVPPLSIKCIKFVNKRQDLELDAFQRYWQEQHGPLAARIVTVRRYEQNHVKKSAYDHGRPVFDGFAVTWFDSTSDMRRGTTTNEYLATRADEANFLPPGRLPMILGREHVIVQ